MSKENDLWSDLFVLLDEAKADDIPDDFMTQRDNEPEVEKDLFQRELHSLYPRVIHH